MVDSPTIQGSNTREKIIKAAQGFILKRGFAGTSIDDILKEVGLTKGGFFYHFKNKAELGRVVLENYARHDLAFFYDFAKQADALSDDPLESTLIFLRLFEEFIVASKEPPAGCLFACYMYGVENFDDEVKRFISDGFRHFRDMYAVRFERIQAKYPPREPVDSQGLSEMIVSIIEGSFILAKSQDDAAVVARSSAHFRRYLQFLFSTD